MFKIILLVIYLLLILTVIFIERKRPTEALLWVVVLVCIPYLGAVLYLVFGSTTAIRITAGIRERRLKNYEWKTPDDNKEALKEAVLSEEDKQVIRFNCNYNHSQITGYEKKEIFTDGESHYRRLFEDIKNARQCIFIQFYTIHHDLVGEAFARALAKKAEEGVKVLVMCDFIANLSTPQKMFEPLIKAGGQVIRLKPYFTHYRSHRKIVAIDHKISYIGGMNIGKQYANLAKKKNPWRDTQVRLEGPCTEILDRYFLTDWLCGVKRKEWSATSEYVESIRPSGDFDVEHLCQFIIGGVDTDKESVKMCYLSMIRSAKKSIRIQTPYFIPDASILDELKTAAASGVKIQLMIPGIKASFFLDPVTTYYCGQLLEYGAEVYKYHGYIHAKTMVIDEELCCIGSVNMDMRSLMVDDEVCGVFYDNTFVKEYTQLFTHDIESCDAYTWKEFVSRTRKERIQESIFLLFAPLF